MLGGGRFVGFQIEGCKELLCEGEFGHLDGRIVVWRSCGGLVVCGGREKMRFW